MSISIVITITTTMIIAMMIIIGNCETYGKDYERMPRLLDVFRHFRQSKESQENRGYIEQCRATNLRKDQLGHVNVFAFLDPSWNYSYRQAVMLELLKKQLEKSGFSNILLFMVARPSDLPEDDTENSMEIKAWLEISKNIQESEHFLSLDKMIFSDVAKEKKGIIFLQDTFELGIWKSFRASKDEVIIIDSCGKITYQIIVPWSILYFPYVKAAILSTYKDDPCGPCYEQSSTVRESIDYRDYLLKTINSENKKINKNLDTRPEVFTDVTMSVEQSKRIENDKYTSTIIPFNVNNYKITTYDITTKVPIIQTTEIPENMKKNDNVGKNNFLTDKNFKITSEISYEQKQTQISTTRIISNFETTEAYKETQDCNFSNKHINGNNHSYPTTNDLNTNLSRHLEEHQIESENILRDTKIQKQKVNKNTKYEELQIQKDESLPLRIILYAPHLHEENGTFKKYTHLVLKTESPDYHDHFNSKTSTSNQKPTVLKTSDSMMLDDKKLAEYVSSVNESPGVYGEIADYWQTIDDDEFNNKNENIEFTDYDYVTAEDTENNVNNTFDNESTLLRPNNIIDPDISIKNNDDLDDFIQRRLIEHYNKLLTWIYYIL
ncbi:uncharacterized protein LOC102676892 isoform X2 [Apis dorsata]|uniref:uncharacterized protein LOC102676892 isoform X2 n=1 Tax=Apis dorsata TaxID=7462 RepID=UPI00129382EC|nr:uncharacterized protein LOC102676892 isoform X2 [Apis dorsata]